MYKYLTGDVKVSVKLYRGYILGGLGLEFRAKIRDGARVRVEVRSLSTALSLSPLIGLGLGLQHNW
jgi:hypothetical protein